MKKQLLVLVFVLFASVVTFAQNTPFDPPTCTPDANHPGAGQQYAYTVAVPVTPGYTGGGTFDWWVTQDVNLLTGAVEPNGGDFIASGVYNTPTAGQTTVNITWNSSALGNGNYYVVIRYRETNTGLAGCSPDNVKVFLVTPQNTFWLRIANALDNTGAAGGDNVCAADVSSAIIVDPLDPGEVEYLYGVTTHYVKISANGYTGSWDATLRLGALTADMEYTSVTWTSGASNGTFTGPAAGGDWTSATQLPSLNTWDPATSTWGLGQEIILTITITHNHHQGLTDLAFTMAIDGSFTLGTPAVTYDDMSNVNGDCTPETAFADVTTQTLKARPTLNPVTPASFIPDPTTQP
ncbi:MAG TPA: hypothetical protein VK172_08430 [Lentimicrobium sp.]|nr:hypothetical protein [Lentimicrobium sp.]